MPNADPFQGHIYGNNLRYDCLDKADDGYPFIYEIMVILVFATFKPLSNIKLYNGSTDLQEHLEAFCVVMLLFSTLDAIMC